MAETKSFPIIGMHCASCAKLIERNLQKVPGVIGAAVNYASEQATVLHDGAVDEKDLGSAVTSAGYKAILSEDADSESEKTPEEKKEEAKKKELQNLKIKVIVSSILSVQLLHLHFG